MSIAAWEQSQLYGIVDLGYVSAERLEEVTLALITGGAGLIQLRAKGCEKADVLTWARQLAPICRRASIPFIVNDFIDIAVEVDADGVHLGQDDGPLAIAREELAQGKIIGRSTHSPEQAAAALAEGADYIGFGPLFPTPTKKGRPGIGLGNIANVEVSVGSQIPVFCIGGIRRDNLSQVIAANARRVVVVSDLLLADDIAEAAQEIVTSLL